MFGGIASALKDRAIVAAARSQLQRHLDGFGEITRLELDTRAKNLEAEVMLKGEVSPVSIRVGRYEIVRRNGEAFVVVHDVSASRPWIGAAIERHVAGREFRLPSTAAAALG